LQKLRVEVAEATNDHAAALSKLQVEFDRAAADHKATAGALEQLSGQKEWMAKEVAGLQAELLEVGKRARAAESKVADLQAALQSREADSSGVAARLSAETLARQEAEAQALKLSQQLEAASKQEQQLRADLAEARLLAVQRRREGQSAALSTAATQLAALQTSQERSSAMADTVLLQRNVARLEHQVQRAGDALASATLAAATAELFMESSPLISSPRLSMPGQPGVAATTRTSASPEHHSTSNTSPDSPGEHTATPGPQHQSAQRNTQSSNSQTTHTVSSSSHHRSSQPSDTDSPYMASSSRHRQSTHTAQSHDPAELQALRQRVQELCQQVEVEKLQASNSELQRHVVELELSAAQKRVSELEGSVRESRIQVQDLQIQLGLARMSSSMAHSSAGPLSHSWAIIEGVPRGTSDMHSKHASSLVQQLGASSPHMTREANSSGLPPIRHVRPGLPPALQPIYAKDSFSMPGSSQLDQQERQLSTMSAMQQALDEVQQLLRAEVLPLAKAAGALKQRTAAAVRHHASLQSAVQQTLLLGEAAAEQLMAQTAQAATAQQELARLRQSYQESQAMLHTLYHEAQLLNTELWEQNDQLTSEVEDLRSKLAEAEHCNALSSIQESGSGDEHEQVSRDVRQPSSQSRTVATSVAGLLAEGRNRVQSQAPLTAQDSSSSLGQEAPRGGEAVQLRAGLAASQREVQRLQALLFDRNKLVTELEAQLLGVAEDIRTFEATVVRVEVLTSSLSLSKPTPALYRKQAVS
jgi:hypothetical protein